MASGLAAEQALTRWARRSRYAGSKDRAAVRDHVYDVLRNRRTAAHLGGGDTGRALMLGLLRQQGIAPNTLFTAEGHAPGPIQPDETPVSGIAPSRNVEWNLPDWLVAAFERSLGPRAEAAALALQGRAPVCLRVNTGRATRRDARLLLEDQGILTAENPLAANALTVIEGARSLRASQVFANGIVELQDATSQAVVDLTPPGRRVLDYCAGGGGKALALAAQPDRAVFAHDIDPGRMTDLPVRAARAGVDIVQLPTAAVAGYAPFDIVLCDVPCSGSGAWRRAPEGKWTLTPERLTELNGIQSDILSRCALLLQRGGVLVYATCSVLQCENEAQVEAFLDRYPGWTCRLMRRFDVVADGDGFFTAHLTRE